MMGGVFTREERAVVIFLVAALSIGSLVMGARRVAPDSIPDFGIAVEPAAYDASVSVSGPVNINAADAEELTRLPGVGPARADAIVRLRSERGGFRSLDELLDVSGIGPVTFERMKPMATVGPGQGTVSDSLERTGPDGSRP